MRQLKEKELESVLMVALLAAAGTGLTLHHYVKDPIELLGISILSFIGWGYIFEIVEMCLS